MTQGSYSTQSKMEYSINILEQDDLYLIFFFIRVNPSLSVVNPSKYNGRLAAIGDAGASNIRYKPYGEVNRGNSYGPDIFRYKYTAQQEDIESGLYYYKSRYYDPNIGQFMQADSVIGLNTPLGTNQYAYTEGNPVRFTDPSGHMSYDSMMNRITKDLTKAAIMEFAGNSDMHSAMARMQLTHMKISQEKKLNVHFTQQFFVSLGKIVVGVILLGTPLNPLGWSLIASGTAGLAGLAAGSSDGYYDKAKGLRTSKLAAGITSIVTFIYKFFDYDSAELMKAAKEGTDTAPVIDEFILNEPSTWLNFRIFSIQWYQFKINQIILENLYEVDLYLLPTHRIWPWNWIGLNLNLTKFFGIESLNFPGYVSWLSVIPSVQDVAAYNPDIRRNRRASVDNPRYYYDEMIRKGIYYTPYVVDFINGEGVFTQ